MSTQREYDIHSNTSQLFVGLDSDYTAIQLTPPLSSNISTSTASSPTGFVTGAAHEEAHNALIELHQQPYSASFLLLSVILSSLVVGTFIGNLFVIIAILVDKNLQTAANLLVLSLAVADFMVACLVMPLGAYNDLHQGWFLGTQICQYWTSADVLCCTASILNLLTIAIDRYWAVTNVDYIYKRTRHRVGLMILCAWLVAAVVSLAPILGWRDPDFEERVHQEHKCLVSQDVGYQIFATVSTFYLPLVLLLALYWRIFQVAKKRIHRKPGRNEAARSALTMAPSREAQHRTSEQHKQLAACSPGDKTANEELVVALEPAAESNDDEHKLRQFRRRLTSKSTTRKSIEQQATAILAPTKTADVPVASGRRLEGGQQQPANCRQVADDNQAASRSKRDKNANHHRSPVTANVDEQNDRQGVVIASATRRHRHHQAGDCSLIGAPALSGSTRSRDDDNNASRRESRDALGADDDELAISKLARTLSSAVASKLIESDWSNDKADECANSEPPAVAATGHASVDGLRNKSEKCNNKRPQNIDCQSQSVHISFASKCSACCGCKRTPASSNLPQATLEQHPKQPNGGCQACCCQFKIDEHHAATFRRHPDALKLNEHCSKPSCLTELPEAAQDDINNNNKTETLGQVSSDMQDQRVLVYACLSGQQHPKVLSAPLKQRCCCAVDQCKCQAKLTCRYAHRKTPPHDMKVNLVNISQVSEAGLGQAAGMKTSVDEQSKHDCVIVSVAKSELDSSDKMTLGDAGDSGELVLHDTVHHEELGAFEQSQRGDKQQDKTMSCAQINHASHVGGLLLASSTSPAASPSQPVSGGPVQPEATTTKQPTNSLNKSPIVLASEHYLHHGRHHEVSHRHNEEGEASLSDKPNDTRIQIMTDCGRQFNSTSLLVNETIPRPARHQGQPKPLFNEELARSDDNKNTAKNLDSATTTTIPVNCCHAHEEPACNSCSCCSDSSGSCSSLTQFSSNSHCHSINVSSSMAVISKVPIASQAQQHHQFQLANISRSSSSVEECKQLKIRLCLEPSSSASDTSARLSSSSESLSTALGAPLSIEQAHSNAIMTPTIVSNCNGGQLGSSANCFNEIDNEPKVIKQTTDGRSSMTTIDKPGDTWSESDEGTMKANNRRVVAIDQPAQLRPLAAQPSRSTLLRRKFKALGQLVSFVQTSRTFNSSSSLPSSEDTTEEHTRLTMSGSKQPVELTTRDGRLCAADLPNQLHHQRQHRYFSHGGVAQEHQQQQHSATTTTTTTENTNTSTTDNGINIEEEEVDDGVVLRNGYSNQEQHLHNATTPTPIVSTIEQQLDELVCQQPFVSMVNRSSTRTSDIDDVGRGRQQQQQRFSGVQQQINAKNQQATSSLLGLNVKRAHRVADNNTFDAGQPQMSSKQDRGHGRRRRYLPSVTREPAPPDAAAAAANCSMKKPQQVALQSAHSEALNSRLSRRANAEIKREKKAAKTLAIITGVFVCCWLPFFLNAIVMPICGPSCTPSDLIMSILLWLGYLNSLLNPLIYTIFSPDFRRAFRRLLCFEKCLS